jgi:2-polyprenyl-3-methyl-5-hydroxy-6-metoxy-1,4-benzoquinol methylase
MKPKLYPCPICKAKKFEEIYTRGVYFDKIIISICKNCGLVCQNPRMSESFFSKYYSSEYYGHYQVTVNITRKPNLNNQSRALLIYEHIRGYIKKSSMILEIGTGLGNNLTILKRKGYKKLFGTEINSACVTKINNLGINCFHGNLEKYHRDNSSKFDLIILSHVLEHLAHPDKALHFISSMLKKNGYLYILVPNFSSPSNPYLQFTLPHTFLFYRDHAQSIATNT